MSQVKMQKFEFDEVNCPESYVELAIRGDLIAEVARCLESCEEDRRQFTAIQQLAKALRIAGNMIYGSVNPEQFSKIADKVVMPDGAVHQQSEDDEDEPDEKVA